MSQQGKDERELWVGELVAQTINSSQGTDYRVHPGDNPPDVVLQSEDGKFDSIGLEVVVIPSVDMVDRDENNNVFKLQNALNHGLGRSHHAVSVHLTNRARREGVPEDLYEEVLSLIRKAMKNADEGSSQKISFRWQAGREQQLSHYFRIIHIVSLSIRNSIVVTFPRAMYITSDGKWIQDAIEHKISKYSRDSAEGWSLAVDGQSYVDREQIELFKRSVDTVRIPFQQVWVVTSFDKATRIK